MPTLSDAPDATRADERRLHPLSWLFVLLQQLRSFAIPIVVLLFTGRGGNSEWFGLIGVVGLTIVSLAQYFTYRYRPGPGGLLIRSGLLQRTNRDIPYERIHTVNLHQTLLHRIFGVTEVRLESAGSNNAEAVMRVLSLVDARALEAVIRERSVAQRLVAADGAAASADATDVPLFTLHAGDILRLGLISNRGMVVVAATFGALWQAAGGRFSSDNFPSVLTTLIRGGRSFVVDHVHQAAFLAVSAFALLLVAFVLVRALSVLLAFLQYHGFTLTAVGRQLRVERGLLTRVRHQLPRRRIQAWRIDETLLHRWFGRQGLRVDSAASTEGDEHGIRQLIPVATPETITSLLQQLIASDAWPVDAWQKVHSRAWRRLFVLPSVGVAIASGFATLQFGPVALVLLLVIPVLIVRARRLAAFAGYAIQGRNIVVRSGWLTKRWGIVDVRKVQALRVTQSPLDRRHGMATVSFDSAGASATEGVVKAQHLPVDDAWALHDFVTRAMDAR